MESWAARRRKHPKALAHRSRNTFVRLEGKTLQGLRQESHLQSCQIDQNFNRNATASLALPRYPALLPEAAGDVRLLEIDATMDCGKFRRSPSTKSLSLPLPKSRRESGRVWSVVHHKAYSSALHSFRGPVTFHGAAAVLAFVGPAY